MGSELVGRVKIAFPGQSSTRNECGLLPAHEVLSPRRLVASAVESGGSQGLLQAPQTAGAEVLCLCVIVPNTSTVGR